MNYNSVTWELDQKVSSSMLLVSFLFDIRIIVRFRNNFMNYTHNLKIFIINPRAIRAEFIVYCYYDFPLNANKGLYIIHRIS